MMANTKHLKEVKANRVKCYVAKSFTAPIVGFAGRPSGYEKEPHTQAALLDISTTLVEQFMKKDRRDFDYAAYTKVIDHANTTYPTLRHMGFRRFRNSRTPLEMSIDFKTVNLRSFENNRPNNPEPVQWQEGVHVQFHAQTEGELFPDDAQEAHMMRNKFFTYLQRRRYFEILNRNEATQKGIELTLQFYDSSLPRPQWPPNL